MPTFEGGLGDLSLDRRHIPDNQAWSSINTNLKREIGALRAVHDNLSIDDLPTNINSINKFLDELFVHSGEALYWKDLITSKRAFASTSPMQVIKFEGAAYLTNGDEFLKTTDGISYGTPFIEAPDISGITLSEDGAGNLAAGIYVYVYTFRPKASQFLTAYNQEESPPSVEKRITITDSKQIDHANLPTSSEFNIIVYRRFLGEGSEFRQAIQIENDSTTFSDNLFFHELGEDILKTEQYATPPIPRHISLHNRNLFMTGITSWPDSNIPVTILDNYLLVSDDGRISGWPKFALDILGETGDKIMNHKPLTENALLVYTKEKIKKVTGRFLLEYESVETFSPVGLAAEWALTDTVQFGHWFLGSNRQLNLFDGDSIIKEAREQFKRIDAIFSKFSNYPHRINWAEREKSRMAFFDGIGYFAYPVVDSTVNNRVLKADMRSPRNIVFTLSDWETTWLFPDIGNNIFYMGNSNGNIKEVEGDGDNFRAVTHQTKDVDGGDVVAPKTYREIRADHASSGTTVTAKLYIDDTLNNTITFTKETRKTVERTKKSFAPNNRGNRASIEFSWPAGTNDAAIYDTAVEFDKQKRP